jgi:hypothetical protein
MQLVLLPVALCLMLYAPGHYLLPANLGDDSRGGSRLLREVLLSACCSSWLGFVLAELGLYSLPALLSLLAALALMGRIATRATRRWQYHAIDLLGPGMMALVCLWTAPPLDTPLRAGDSAGYLASGVHLARHGSLIIHDPTLPSVSPDLKRTLFPSVAPDGGSPPYLRLQGSLILRSLDSDEVLPAFHHLITVWIAAADGVAGTHATACVITLFAGLSLWAMVEFAVLASGPTVALLCLASLLLLSPQYWYSRFLMPEVPGQFFLWGGLWCLACWSHSQRRSDLLLAGAAFGIAGLMRLENIGFLLVAVITACYLLPPQARRPLAPILVFMLPLWLHAAVHLWVFRTHYVGNLHAFATETWATFSEPLPLMFGGAALAAVLWLKLAHRWGTTARIPWHLVCLVIALGLSLYGDYRHAWVSTSLLAYYCGVPLLIGGGLGLLISARAARDGGPALQLLFLLVALVLIQVIAEPHATPVPIWMIRRAVTVLLPALCLGVALLCRAVAQQWHWSVAAAIFALTAAGEVRSLRPLWQGGYYAGATRHVEAVAALIQPGARLFIDNRLIGSGLDVSLWLEHDWPVYFLAASDRSRIRELAVRFEGAPLYWLSDGNSPPPQGGRILTTPIALYQFVLFTPVLDTRSAPGATANWEYSIGLYSLRVMKE